MSRFRIQKIKPVGGLTGLYQQSSHWWNWTPTEKNKLEDNGGSSFLLNKLKRAWSGLPDLKFSAFRRHFPSVVIGLCR